MTSRQSLQLGDRYPLESGRIRTLRKPDRRRLGLGREPAGQQELARWREPRENKGFPVFHSPARGGRSSSPTPDLAEQRARTSRHSCRPWRGSGETEMLHSPGLTPPGYFLSPCGLETVPPARCHPNRAGCSGRGAAGRSVAPAAHAESQDKAAESLRSFLPSFPWGVLRHALRLSILISRQNVLTIDPAS
jgi:hypothetical protein